MRNAFSRLPKVSSRSRSLILLAVDGAIAAASLYAAFYLRFLDDTEGIPGKYTGSLGWTMAILVAARMLSSRFFSLDRWSFRYSDLEDGARLGLAAACGTGLFVLSVFFLRTEIKVEFPPRSVIVLELLLSGAAMAAARFVPRLVMTYLTDMQRKRRKKSIRTLILGAGSSGEMLQRDLKRSDEHDYHIVGFVDDKPEKQGQLVGGRPVLGSVEDLPRLAKEHRVGQLLVAIPRPTAQRLRRILTVSATAALKIKILPVSYVYLQEKGAISLLKDLSLEDLLERAEVSFDHGEEALAGRRLMVFGAAGSIGSEICHQLLALGGDRLVMADIDENGLYVLQRRFERLYPGRQVVAEVADIREWARVNGLFAEHRPQDVFHAAARKHVPLMERLPCEAVKTNVLGTHHLVRAAQRFDAERFVFTSTDKAVAPSSVMGATKRLGEMLVRSMERPGFSIVRFGNVLDSAGSVVPLFREQIEAGGPVTVTDAEVKRFFMSISEAVGLVLKAAYGDYGRLCVLEMGEPLLIDDLARHMISLSGAVPGVDIAIEYSGLRPGEKIEESLVAEDEHEVKRVDRRIYVVEGPPPRPDLEALLEKLEAATAVEENETARRLLRRAVPSYLPEVEIAAEDR